MSNEIREAVQMVLTRMETHPDDFYDNDQLVRHSSSRFGWVWNALNISSFSYGLNETEIDALKQGFDKLMYRKFHDRVLESMLNDPKQDEKMDRQGSSLKPSTKLMPLTQGQMAVAKKLGLNATEYAAAIAPTFKA
jgi:hypothetical protein